jgi:hypothetical protein
MKSNIAVYNSRLAKILVNKGYHIIDLAINHKNNRCICQSKTVPFYNRKLYHLQTVPPYYQIN